MADLRSAAGLAHDRDVLRIAAEARDIVAHPLKRADQIEIADIARGGELLAELFREVEIAEGVEAMVDRDDHNVALLGQIAPVIGGPVARPVGIAAAVEPDHHRALAPIARRGGPHVEEQAILIVHLRLGRGREDRLNAAGHFGFVRAAGRIELHARRAVAGGVGNAFPGFGLGGWLKAKIAQRRRGVADTEEGIDASLLQPLDRSRFGFHHGGSVRKGRLLRAAPRIPLLAAAPMVSAASDARDANK